MPAEPSRIGFILNQFRRSVVEDLDVKARYGSAARQSDDPIPTFFDNEADADVIAAERQDLQSKDRRRFRVAMTGAEDVLNIDLSSVAPLVRYVDTRRSADMPAILCEVSIDLGRDSTTAILWG